MKGLFIPDITAEMFRNGCLESIEVLMAEGEIYDIEYPSAQPEIIMCKDCRNWDTTWQNDWVKNYHYCPLVDGIRKGDWYCADAERRTDE